MYSALKRVETSQMLKDKSEIERKGKKAKSCINSRRLPARYNQALFSRILLLVVIKYIHYVEIPT